MALSWAAQRKITYVSFFGIIFLIFIVLPLFLVFHKAPTCYDAIQNGSERGVDCGGSCEKMCSSDFLSPNILWSRFQKVAHGVYNVGAYIENPNSSGVARGVPYIFKVYDQQGIPIVERSGVGYFPAHQNVLIFEPSVLTGERIPARVTFEFTASLDWYKESQSISNLVVVDKQLLNATSSPRLETTIENSSVKTLEAIDVVGIAYDINDNMVAFSKTKIDSLGAGQRTRVVFTWPLPLEKDVARIEIIPTIKP